MGRVAQLPLPFPYPCPLASHFHAASFLPLFQSQPILSLCPSRFLSQGENPIHDEFNAIHVADTPHTDRLKTISGRWRTIKAHGKAVGLPSDADMGNSEVGHNALGAGQVIDQGASLVDKALASGSLFGGDGWKDISSVFPEGTLHLIGLLSDGGVHSRTDQLYGIIRGAASHGAKKIRVHVLTDGRDVADGSSIKFTKELEGVLKETKAAHPGLDAAIASGGGRMHVTMVGFVVAGYVFAIRCGNEEKST